MFDSTIHSGTLRRHFKKSDFNSKIWEIKDGDKERIILKSLDIFQNGFSSVNLRFNKLGDKPVFRQSSLAQALLIRHASESIRRITSVRQSDRNSIIRSLIQLCSEGVAFNIIKIDIKSFYETVNIGDILSNLKNDSAFSRQSIFVLESFFSALARQSIQGLPRGIGLSATLAEYVMRNFDRKMSSHFGVRYYSRYVDDAIAITAHNIDSQKFLDFSKNLLPEGLVFNNRKTNSYEFQGYSKGGISDVEHIINFLGYEITVHKVCSKKNIGNIRDVGIEISKSKICRIKRKIAKSLLDFNENRNFDDLLNRIKLLTSNYGYIDEDSGMQRYAGLRYNYSLIDPKKSKSLKSLDKFLVNVITSKHPNNRIRPNISQKQCSQLLGLRFVDGFIENRFFTFKTEHLTHLIGCWAYA